MAKIIQEVSGRIKDVEESSNKKKTEEESEKILEIQDLLDQFSDYEEDELVKSPTATSSNPASEDSSDQEDEEEEEEDEEGGEDKKVAKLLNNMLKKDGETAEIKEEAKKEEKAPRKPKQLDDGLFGDIFSEEEEEGLDQDQSFQKNEDLEAKQELKEENQGLEGTNAYGSGSQSTPPKKIVKEEPKEICEPVNQSNRAQVNIEVFS